MKTTITDQIKSIEVARRLVGVMTKANRVAKAYNRNRRWNFVDHCLNDAGSSLAALNFLLTPTFQGELEAFLETRENVCGSTAQDVVDFLREKGLPL